MLYLGNDTTQCSQLYLMEMAIVKKFAHMWRSDNGLDNTHRSLQCHSSHTTTSLQRSVKNLENINDTMPEAPAKRHHLFLHL